MWRDMSVAVAKDGIRVLYDAIDKGMRLLLWHTTQTYTKGKYTKLHSRKQDVEFFLILKIKFLGTSVWGS